MASYEIAPIDPDVVKELLIADDAGRPPRVSVDVEGGSPLRCCLSLAGPGERVALVAYEPLRRWAASTGADPGPYLERGPVFVHADGCEGWSGGVPYARPRRRVFRFYDSNGSILDGRLVEAGEDHGAVLAESFADERVALVHVRAVEFGCFFYEARRFNTVLPA